MADTIFAKIIRGELPCHRVYEDERVLAFLDINPVAPGHTLVLPKTAVETVDQLDDEDAAAIGRVLPRVCRAVLQATGASEFNVLSNNGSGAGQSVDHVHFHVIPRMSGGGFGVKWLPGKLEAEQGKQLAASIAAAIAR